MNPISHRFRAIVCLATGCFLTGLPTHAAVPLEAGIQSHLGKLTESGQPGIAVLVARDGKIVYQGGFGLADIDKKQPVTPETRFRIGSITKQFTAAAILRLAEQGKLSIEDPLSRFFPDFPNGDRISLQQLLTHTSGIHSYTDKPGFLATVTQPISPAELITSFRDDPPDFAPGAGFHYNNSAYLLLGEIVAKVSGKPFSTTLGEMFFEPLGMKHTGVYQNAAPPVEMASGYSMADGKAAPALDWDMSRAGGAGALYSTVGDLFLWNEALFNGKVLQENSFKAMITPVKLPEGVDGMSYGFGLALSTVSRLPVISHSGGLNGWSSDLIRFPEPRCTVIALANALPPVAGFEPSTVTRQIAAKLLEDEIGKLPPAAVDATADPKIYPEFIGRYRYPNAELTVSVVKDHLFAQLTGQDSYEIFPAAKDEFFWKITDAKITFLRDDTGKVNAVRHTQSANSFRAERINEPAIKFTDAELDAVLGQYQYGPSTVLTVTREGQTVFSQLTGQPKFPIFPKSATEFEWRVVKASITFKKDSGGKVTGATHQQNGTSFEAAKIK